MSSSIYETYELLQRMYELMQKLEIQSIRTEQQVNSNLQSFRQLERVVLRYLVLVRNAGLPPEAQKLLDALSKIIITIRMVQIAFNTLYLNMGPVGWAMFVANMFMVASSIGDMAGSFA